MPYIDYVETRLREIGIMPEIQKIDAADALDLADALTRGGLPLVEITLQNEADAEVIRAIRNNRPDMIVGAGSVVNEDQAFLAAKMGAHFITTPDLNPELVKFIRKSGMLVFPGCSTMADLEAAAALKVKAVKFCPAEASGGVEVLAKAASIYPELHIIPSGDICGDTVRAYLDLSTVLACGCSCMEKCLSLKEGKWEAVQKQAEAAVKNI